jgi:signal transduction histidine kinase
MVDGVGSFGLIPPPIAVRANVDVIRLMDVEFRPMADDRLQRTDYRRSMPRETPDVLSVVQRLQDWARRHGQLLDVLFAAFVGSAALTDVLGANPASHVREVDAAAVALIGIGSAALIWRRQYPLTALAVAFSALGVYYVRDYGSFMSIVGIVAIYSVAAHAENRRRAWIAAVGCSLAIVGVAWFTILDDPSGINTANAAGMITYLAAGMVGGAIVRNRQQLFADSELRAELAERDRLAEAERAVALERTRIAREMHDVVAHGMSVISVQAAAAQEIVHTDPEKAAEVMGRIENVGRQSLNEMRRMLGVLRNGDAESAASLTPQPSLVDVGEAVERSTEAGVTAELVVSGVVRDLPPGVELTGFRIVQEALTNVLKHAGSAASVTVTIDYGADDLVIDVSDNGRGAISALSNSGGGNGLLGMRERVEIYGGTLSAGPRAGGGYSVRAVLPTGETVPPLTVSANSRSTGSFEG